MNTALEQIKTSISKVKELRHLNFLITETFDLAEKQCEEAIKNGKQPFEFVVKDNYAVKDVKMTCASKMLKDFIAPYTATCVQRLVDGGGCLIGKSNMDEFAMGSTCTSGYFGPVKHSIYATNQSFEDEKEGDDDFLIAGGSSGGCAVAVATGVAKCGLASDTGGSARYPAVLNGIYGFKPSYGHLSRHGLVPLANALDTPSIMTKSISDCKRYFDLLKGQDPMDITTLPDNLHSQKVHPMPKNLKELTIGIPKYERTDLLSKDAEEIYQKIINLLISNGVVIKQVLLPNLEYAVNCYSVVVDVEIASNMARFDGIRYGYCINKEQLINDDSFIAYIKRNRSESLGTGVKRRIFAGNYYSLNENYNKYVNKAAKIQRLIQKDFSTIFNQNIHCILTPVSRHSAPLFSQIKRRNREEQRLEDYFMAPANLSETAGIRCFCDKQTCGGGALVCAGKYCLIGLRNDDVSGGNKLEQHCVDEQIYSNKKVGCEKEWQKWAEVCICDESLCNTFAFLRSQIDGNYEEQQQQRLIASDYADSSALTRWKETAILRRDSNNNNIRIGENILDSNEENEPNSRRRWMERQQNKQGGGRGRGANLVLLLVVLPLVVGAFTVFLVFLNYHCKML